MKTSDQKERECYLVIPRDDSVVLETTGETKGSADSMHFKEIINVIIEVRFSDQNQE